MNISRSTRAQRTYSPYQQRRFTAIPFGHFLRRHCSVLYTQRNLLSKKELFGILSCIEFIKKNIRLPGLFVNYGSQRPVDTILKLIRKGDPKISLYLNQCTTARQCAAALMAFLKNLRAPLLPIRVQDLMIAKNENVASLTVALDALGLLQQDVEMYHMKLLCALFELMRLLATTGSMRPSETQMSFVPHLFMSVMFKQSYHSLVLHNWPAIMDCLFEMILNSERMKPSAMSM